MTHIYTLTSNDESALPTKDRINSVFDTISKLATSEDVIFIYLSGHGISTNGEDGDFYFLTRDANSQDIEVYNNKEIREERAISSKEIVNWLKKIPASKQVMIIDACGSGKAVDLLAGAGKNVNSSRQRAIDKMKIEQVCT